MQISTPDVRALKLDSGELCPWLLLEHATTEDVAQAAGSAAASKARHNWHFRILLWRATILLRRALGHTTAALRHNTAQTASSSHTSSGGSTSTVHRVCIPPGCLRHSHFTGCALSL